MVRGWSNSHVLRKELCSILRGVWPNLKWQNGGDSPLCFFISRGRSCDQQHRTLADHRSLTDGAVVNMIAHSAAGEPHDDQGGSLAASVDPPSHDQGGHADSEPGEDDANERVRAAVAANQAENDQLLETLRQRVAALDAPAAAPPRLNPFQTPGTVRLQPGGRGSGRAPLLVMNQTPSTHIAAWRLLLWDQLRRLLCWRRLRMGISRRVRTKWDKLFSQNSSPSLEHSRGG